MSKPTDKPRPCPKCKCYRVRWYEIYAQPFFFDQNETGIAGDGGEQGKPDEIIDLFGRCLDCKHEWKPRGAKMVTQLPGYRENMKSAARKDP